MDKCKKVEELLDTYYEIEYRIKNASLSIQLGEDRAEEIKELESKRVVVY